MKSWQASLVLICWMIFGIVGAFLYANAVAPLPTPTEWTKEAMDKNMFAFFSVAGMFACMAPFFGFVLFSRVDKSKSKKRVKKEVAGKWDYALPLVLVLFSITGMAVLLDLPSQLAGLLSVEAIAGIENAISFGLMILTVLLGCSIFMILHIFKMHKEAP